MYVVVTYVRCGTDPLTHVKCDKVLSDTELFFVVLCGRRRHHSSNSQYNGTADADAPFLHPYHYHQHPVSPRQSNQTTSQSCKWLYILYKWGPVKKLLMNPTATTMSILIPKPTTCTAADGESFSFSWEQSVIKQGRNPFDELVLFEDWLSINDSSWLSGQSISLVSIKLDPPACSCCQTKWATATMKRRTCNLHH